MRPSHRSVWCWTTELDRENPDFPPYLTSHRQKIESARALLAIRSEVADWVCTALQVWSAQCGHNISALEVAQSYSITLRPLFGNDPNQPNFCSIADGVIIRRGIRSSGCPYLILWAEYIVFCAEGRQNFYRFWILYRFVPTVLLDMITTYKSTMHKLQYT